LPLRPSRQAITSFVEFRPQAYSARQAAVQ
jgi:hypothetical protein